LEICWHQVFPLLFGLSLKQGSIRRYIEKIVMFWKNMCHKML
jgi:hypothetical protein